MSGTPIRNRTSEFFTILNLIQPKLFPSWKQFTTDYCNGHYEDIYVRGGGTKSVYKTDGNSNWRTLNRKLRHVMIRREKQNVLEDLPEKTRQIVRVELSEKQLKHYMKKEEVVYKDSLDWPMHLLEWASELRIWAFKHKSVFVWEAIEQNLDANQSVVVFYHHKKVGQLLEEYCAHNQFTYCQVDGDVDPNFRQMYVDQFQDGKYQVFIASTLAMGVGFTLTKAHTAIFAEPQWSPADIVQAEDRLLRIGQENAVLSLHICAQGTIEELFYDKLEEKMEVLGKILDENEQVEGFKPAAIKFLKDRHA